jgi:hypothetical protein
MAPTDRSSRTGVNLVSDGRFSEVNLEVKSFIPPKAEDPRRRPLRYFSGTVERACSRPGDRGGSRRIEGWKCAGSPSFKASKARPRRAAMGWQAKGPPIPVA